MNLTLKSLCVALLGLPFISASVSAQTDGAAMFEVQVNDYNGAGAEHWTVAWVTTASGTFIKTLRKQGPVITSSHWNSHCRVWYTAKGASTAIDGLSGATAFSYSGTNSPVIWTWNCRDANNNLVPDGDYKFWVQYAEDDGQGPYTTNGLAWTKGLTGVTNSPTNLGANFTNLRVEWRPVAPPPPPNIASVRLEGSKLILSGTGTANRTYHVLTSPNADTPAAQWNSIATNSFNSAGNFSFTNNIDGAVPRLFYKLQIP